MWDMSSFVWIILAVILGVIELLSTTFILLWVAFSAFVTGILSLFLHVFGIQLLVFIFLSIILLILTRPLVKRWRGSPTSTYQSNVQRLVGEEGVMVSKIMEGKTGMVRVGNETWSARGEFPEAIVERGDRVLVVAVKSSLLIVRRVVSE